MKFLRIVSTHLAAYSPQRFLQTNLKRLLLLVLGGAVFFYTMGPVADPLSAAVEMIEAFTVTVTGDSVKMNWSTASEFGVDHFEILCKDANEPDAAYHVIQTIDAVGSVDAESAYEFIVTTGLEQGKAYCFRLQEVTSNDDPGDVFDRCGYGFDITPTPGLAPTLTPIPTFTPVITTTLPISLTATAISLSPLESPLDGRSASQGEQPVDPNAATPTETSTATPTETPTETSTVTPTPTFESTATFTPTPTETSTATATAPATFTPTVAATVTTTNPITATATLTATVSVTMTVTPTGTGALNEGPSAPDPTDDGSGAGIPNFDELAAQVDPNAPYIVVTYTPSPEPLELALIYTPVPTAPAATLSLANFLSPTTENVVVMLLCLTFFSASGLGIMGLLTSALYLRSRDNRRRRDRRF